MIGLGFKTSEKRNAIGAAIAQISGQMERVFFFDGISREEALEFAKNSAVDEAIRAGADPAKVEIVDVEEVPLAYIGKASRIRIKAAGSLAE